MGYLLYGTPEGTHLHFCFKYKIKQVIPCGITCLMVRRKGLEPLTYWFVASHSIQLSDRRITHS